MKIKITELQSCTSLNKVPKRIKSSLKPRTAAETYLINDLKDINIYTCGLSRGEFFTSKTFRHVRCICIFAKCWSNIITLLFISHMISCILTNSIVVSVASINGEWRSKLQDEFQNISMLWRQSYFNVESKHMWLNICLNSRKHTRIIIPVSFDHSLLH